VFVTGTPRKGVGNAATSGFWPLSSTGKNPFLEDSVMRISALAPVLAIVPMVAMAQEAPKDEATVVNGRVRVTNDIYSNKDLSKPTKYNFALDRARVWMSRTVKGVETNIQLRFESDQNGKGNEDATDPSIATSSVINRAYMNFKDVAPGLNIQVGKQLYKFADDADYGVAATDAQATYGTVNSGYGLGIFADYKIPGDLGTAHVAITNGNGKTNTDNNSQKAFVGLVKLVPMKGIGLNLGYAVDALKKDADKNVIDTYYTAGVTTAQDLTFVELGLEYNLRATKKDSDYYGTTSGSGLATRVGYKLDNLKLIGVYNMLQKNLKDETATSYFGGTLDSKTKTPKGQTIVAAAEYTVGSAIVGAQYKMAMDTVKIQKDKNGSLDGKSYGEAKLYSQVNF
jgi:hypothetical protein